jgi:phospholipase/carboxylesterase
MSEAVVDDVSYRELDDLSHSYPYEVNAAVLNWLSGEQ